MGGAFVSLASRGIGYSTDGTTAPPQVARDESETPCCVTANPWAALLGRKTPLVSGSDGYASVVPELELSRNRADELVEPD